MTLLLIAVGLIFGAVVSIGRYFTVKHIQCQLASGQECPTDLAISLEVLRGASMFFVDYAGQISQSSVISQPVSLVHIHKIFPKTVLITFQPESVAYMLENNGQSAVISESGKIFTQQFETSPTLVVETQTAIDTGNGTIDASIHHTILTIIETAAELQLPLTRITWVDKSTIRLSMENRAEAFILDSERPTLALHRLALVLKSNEYKELTEPKTELDLRFTMPVLRTLP